MYTFFPFPQIKKAWIKKNNKPSLWTSINYGSRKGSINHFKIKVQTKPETCFYAHL